MIVIGIAIIYWVPNTVSFIFSLTVDAQNNLLKWTLLFLSRKEVQFRNITLIAQNQIWGMEAYEIWWGFLFVKGIFHTCGNINPLAMKNNVQIQWFIWRQHCKIPPKILRFRFGRNLINHMILYLLFGKTENRGSGRLSKMSRVPHLVSRRNKIKIHVLFPI